MAMPTVALALALLAGAVLETVVLRLTVVLPGVALRADVRILTGREATRGQTETFLLLAIIWSAISVVCDVVIDDLSAANGFVGFGYSFVWLWVQTMIGLSILTTLYGHYVEGRRLT